MLEIVGRWNRPSYLVDTLRSVQVSGPMMLYI
jgi:hypothetical protein